MAKTSYLDAISSALREEMQRDDRVFLLGEDIGAFGGAFKVTRGLQQAFGAERCMDTPLSDSGIAGAAIGAAMVGLRPVVEFQFADFISCAFTQIVNMAAKVHYRYGAKVPVVFRAPSGGGLSAGPFHSQNPEAWFAHVPGLKVVCPATPADAKGLMKAAIRDDNPVLYFEPKSLYRKVEEEIPEGDVVTPMGRAVVRREGTDASVVAYGTMVHAALQAAAVLAAEGVSVEVLDLRTLVPLDVEAILATVKKTSRVLVAHEDTLTGGFGGEIAALIAERAFSSLDAPVKRLGALDVPVPYASTLEQFVLPNADKMAAALRDLMRY